MNSRERSLRALVRSAGLTIDDIRMSGGSHVRIAARVPDGRTGLFFFASSGSDWRGDRNKLAELRRFARAGGGRAAA